MKNTSTKLKYIEFKPLYVALVVILAVILRFWGENSITILQKEVPEIKTTEISGAEIYRYLRTKPIYIKQNFNIDWEWAQRSNFEELLDKNIHEWFLINKWRPARFVYVQNRLKKILNHIYQRENKLQKADELDQQAKQFEKIFKDNPLNENAEQEAARLHKQAEDIRYYQDRDIRYAGITEKEEKIVIQNLQTLKRIIEP